MPANGPPIAKPTAQQEIDGLHRAKAAREFGRKLRKDKPIVFTNRVTLRPQEERAAL